MDTQLKNLFFIENSNTSYKSSHQRCSVEIGVLKNFTKFTGKHLCQRSATLLTKRLCGFTEHLRMAASVHIRLTFISFCSDDYSGKYRS